MHGICDEPRYRHPEGSGHRDYQLESGRVIPWSRLHKAAPGSAVALVRRLVEAGEVVPGWLREQAKEELLSHHQT